MANIPFMGDGKLFADQAGTFAKPQGWSLSKLVTLLQHDRASTQATLRSLQARDLKGLHWNGAVSANSPGDCCDQHKPPAERIRDRASRITAGSDNRWQRPKPAPCGCRLHPPCSAGSFLQSRPAVLLLCAACRPPAPPRRLR